MIDVKSLTIEKANQGLRQGDFTVRELVGAYASEAKKRNPEINAYLEIFSDFEEDIVRAETMLKKGKATALTGIPIAVKDNILIKGKIASAASKILENYTATYDATVIEKLKTAGAIIIGRTNMDEFAMGSSTENSGFGVTKNPLDISRVPGGSSGGSAAAVAASGALASLGSDTGGSIRQPAALCGLVGLLPTYGTVSRNGLIAMASSLDQIGPLAKTVNDAEIIFDLISGFDPRENTSVPEEKRSVNVHEKKILGVPRSFLASLSKETAANFEESLLKLKNAGYKIIDIDLPLLKYALPAYYIIMPAEASTNLARFDGMRYGPRREGGNIWESFMDTRNLFGGEVRRRVILGTFVLSHGYRDAYYNKAGRLRRVIKKEFTEAFNKVDAIALPTTPSGAFKIGQICDPVAMYLSDIFTVGANIANLPALAVPFGSDDNKMPLSVQFIGRPFSEKTLFKIGRIVEKQ